MAATDTTAARMKALFPMNESVPPASLLRDVGLLCLDAGNTVVFLDHTRVARLCAGLGIAVDAAALVRTEGEAKVALEEQRMLTPTWSMGEVASARGWGRYLGTMLHLAGVPLEGVGPALDAMWKDHVELNLWSLVPAGLPEALGRARAAGIRVAVVSNSEGHLDALLVRLGIHDCFDLVIDSALAGVEKPDPRIFHLALERFGIPASRALHLGDIYATDVVGARAAGVRVALIDPHDHLAGRHPDVPRVAGAAQVADALARTR